jgi:hypothetical protein
MSNKNEYEYEDGDAASKSTNREDKVTNSRQDTAQITSQ